MQLKFIISSLKIHAHFSCLLLAAAATQIAPGPAVFVDIAQSAGLHFQTASSATSQKYLPESMVGGVAMLDYDGDGRMDLYFVNGAALADPMMPGKLPDKSDPRYWNRLYHNNGDGTFTDVTEKAKVAGDVYGMGVAAGDYDNDGRTDLYITNLGRNTLYHNNGDSTFADVSVVAGFTGSPGKGLGIVVNDFDRDGWPDILVANDSFQQQLFRNRHDGTFEEIGLPAGVGYDEDGKAFAGMGVDAADYDRDGWPDLFIDALANQRYALFRNVKGSFEYSSRATGVAGATQVHSGWGAKFIDYDNDGWLDLFVAQGHVMDNIEATSPGLRYREAPLLLRNIRGKFSDVSATSGAVFLKPVAARGAAFGDLDNDGFIDAAISVKDGPAMILHNRGGSGNHWLTLRPVGRSSNRAGIGAAVRVIADDGSEQQSYVTCSGSYMSSNDGCAHFGLGAAKSVKLLESPGLAALYKSCKM